MPHTDFFFFANCVYCNLNEHTQFLIASHHQPWAPSLIREINATSSPLMASKSYSESGSSSVALTAGQTWRSRSLANKARDLSRMEALLFFEAESYGNSEMICYVLHLIPENDWMKQQVEVNTDVSLPSPQLLRPCPKCSLIALTCVASAHILYILQRNISPFITRLCLGFYLCS